MTTQPITDKELLYVPLPENSVDVQAHSTCLTYYVHSKNLQEAGTARVNLPAHYQFIGVMPGMSEDEANKCIDDCPYYAKCWKNYMAPKETETVKHPPEWSGKWSCATRIQSLLSRMEAAGALMKNPYGEHLDEDDFERYPLPICFDPDEELKELNLRSDRIKRDWHSAEAKRADMLAVLRIVKT